MANESGWASLGNILGGGIDREGNYQLGRYRSAQTESALANARESQAKAIRAEQINTVTQALREHAPDFNDPTDANLADLITAGLGGDYNSAMSGRKTGHDINLKTEIANPGTSYGIVNRDRAALGETPFNPIDAVGTQGAFIDTRSPDKAVQPPLGEALFPTEPTPAIRNYEYGERLPADKKDSFGRMVRSDQVLNGGGVPYVRTTGTGTVSAPVDAGTVADNTKANAGAKAEGTGLAKRTLDLPAAKGRVAASDQKWDALANAANTLQSDEALWKAVGLGKPLSSIPGTEGARIRAQINTLKTKVGFSVLQDMRDNSKTGGALGQVSDRENNYLQNALAALDTNLAPEDFREQLQIVLDYANGAKKRVHDAFNETYPELSTAAKAPAGGGNVPTFATEAEAEAAGIKPGTRVVIGGVSGKWQ